MGKVNRLGLVVGRNETWSFINDLYDDWQQAYNVEVFKERSIASPILKERLNRRRLRGDLLNFILRQDVVFFEWASELLAMSSHLVGHLSNRPRLITRLHRYELYEWAEHVNWDTVDAVILVSEAKKKEFLGRFPTQEDKCVVIPEAVNLSKFDYVPKPFDGNIGILCHLSPRKRVYELILAFYQLKNVNPSIRLFIGGGTQQRYADYYWAMNDLVRGLGLQDSVTFDGPVRDTVAWYRKIDIYVSNGYSEGLQVSPMEAMASGCFTLAHWWAGADELLPKENLFFTDAELIQSIQSFFELSEEAKRKRVDALRRIVEMKFDSQITSQAIRDLIEQGGGLGKVQS